MPIGHVLVEKLRADLPRAARDEFSMHYTIGLFNEAGVGPTLAGLCDGKVSMARLDAAAPRAVWEKMVYLIDLWMNAFAGGSEVITIGSPAVSTEEDGVRHKALQTMALALEAAGVLRIDTVTEGKHTQFSFTLVDEDPARPDVAAQAPNTDFPAVMARTGPRYAVCVRFIGNGRALSGSRTGAMTLWDLHAGRALHTYQGHTATIWSIACSADGTRAVTASGDCTMRLWHVATGQCLRVFSGHDDPLRSVEISPDGRRAVTGGWSNTIRVWDLDSGRCLHRYECRAGSMFSDGLAVSMAASRAFSKAPYRHHAIWCLGTGACIGLVKFAPYPFIMTLSEDGCFVLAHQNADVGKEMGRLHLWNLQELTLAITFAPFPGQKKGTCRPDCLALSPCGRYVAAGYDNGQIHVWNRADGTWLRLLDRHAGPVIALHFGEEGLFLLSASQDRTIRLWEIATGKCMRMLAAPDQRAQATFAVLPGIDLAQPLHPNVPNNDAPLSDLNDTQTGAELPVVLLTVPLATA